MIVTPHVTLPFLLEAEESTLRMVVAFGDVEFAVGLAVGLGVEFVLLVLFGTFVEVEFMYVHFVMLVVSVQFVAVVFVLFVIRKV